MQANFISKTRHSGIDEAEFALLGFGRSDASKVGSRTDIKAAHSSTNNIHRLVTGWACKHKLTCAGERQIISFLLPGDICDLDRLYDADAGFSVTALTNCTVATVPASWLAEARRSTPAVKDMLWSLMTREHAALTEQIIALGRRTARQRTACLLHHLYERLEALGLVKGEGFHMPATQADLADALALSVVHVNRTLQSLREDGLIKTRGRTIIVPNKAALARAARLEQRNEEKPAVPLGVDRAAFHGRDDNREPAGRCAF